MDCKRAWEEAGGDFEKAVALIHERGIAKAAKKSERSTGAGIVASYIHGDRLGVLVDLRCETDFVARADEFRQLAREIAMQIAAMNPSSVNELMGQPYIKDESNTMETLVKRVIAKVGENIKVDRFSRYEI